MSVSRRADILVFLGKFKKSCINNHITGRWLQLYKNKNKIG
jgi:hypothetical protein